MSNSWDLTTEVGVWVTRNQTNTGITLEGSSLPIQIASPFDPANPDPATTPYLDVTPAKPSATQGGVTPNSVGLTAGMDGPDDGECDYENNTIAILALYGAAHYGSLLVPQQFLGASVHPYSYMTNEQETGYWKNYGYFATNTVCTNLNYMIEYWRAEMNAALDTQSQSPLIISETNFLPALPSLAVSRIGPLTSARSLRCRPTKAAIDLEDEDASRTRPVTTDADGTILVAPVLRHDPARG